MSIGHIIAAAGSKAGRPSGWELPFNIGNFTNASPRHLLDPQGNQLLGPFATNVLATVNVGGRTLGQFEAARTNTCLASQDIEDEGYWTLVRLYAVTADATADPLGNVTAEEIVPNTTVGGHYVRQFTTVDGSSYYTHSGFAKAGDTYDKVRFNLAGTRFVGSPQASFNLTTGTAISCQDCVERIVGVGNGWYYCSITAQSDVSGSAQHDIYVLNEAGDVSYAGDNSKSIYLWGVQMEPGRFGSSYIHTTTSALLRNKDQFYWNAVDVPSAIKNGTWAFQWVPEYASTEVAANRYIAHVTGENSDLRLRNTDQLQIRQNNVSKVLADAITWSRGSLITVTLDAAAGSITIAGADSGNGTTVGTAWTWPSGNLYYAMASTTVAQIDSLLSEPYAP